jgi:hypothetical protein
MRLSTVGVEDTRKVIVPPTGAGVTPGLAVGAVVADAAGADDAADGATVAAADAAGGVVDAADGDGVVDVLLQAAVATARAASNANGRKAAGVRFIGISFLHCWIHEP